MTVNAEPKRHHFVPVTYLKQFTDEDGFLHVYRKGDLSAPFLSKPERTGFANHYYSQPLPNGTTDNSALERVLGTIETEWPNCYQRIVRQTSISHREFVDLITFMLVQRVHVPACRDTVEHLLATHVKTSLRELALGNHLPPLPREYPSLLDNIEVSIDPHQSLYAMTGIGQGFSRIIDQIGFEFVHNKTEIPFISSDNPVSAWNPTVPEKLLRPYHVDGPKPIMELFFPVSSRILLRGHTTLKRRFSLRGPGDVETRNKGLVTRANRITARFGYQQIFASGSENGPLIDKWRSHSPVIDSKVASHWDGDMDKPGMVFGPVPPKPK